MSGSFDRLSSALQYQIVNTLGFRELRPVQELSTGPILDGKNVVVLAPTAGGKTEAAFFPLLSRMDTEDWRPASMIYVAPLRALLNNQESRIERYAATLGRRAFKWHGDVAAGRKAAFLNDPTDILLTTPESLEVMLMSARVPTERVFANLRAVVIDEIHAFVSDDRGGHLSAVLERLTRFCGKDLQRIGLSATVGNPETILTWVAGSSTRPAEVVRAPKSTILPKLSMDFVGSEENAARVIAELHPGKKRLVFVDSRRGVESVGKHLRGLGVETFVTHSSLSIDERRAAEAAFENAKDCVIVATSALELGIDIGDLDHVLQVDSPATVASFLQRMGRTGRRPEMVPNFTFLATKDESLWVATGLVNLYRSGYVEPVKLRQRAAHLLAHQILALAIQEGGIPVSDWWAWVAHATPFQKVTEADRAALVAHMLENEILHQDGGLLSLGTEGERLYGFRNFGELYAVFSTPQTLTVLWGAQEIGTIDATFVEQEELGRLTFTLGARPWRATSIDWSNGVVHVEPAQEGGLARWQGGGQFLGQSLCQAMRRVLGPDSDDPCWSQRARDRIKVIREEHAAIPLEGLSLQAEGGGYRLWTFAGARANNLLSAIFESLLGEKVTSSNLYLRFKQDAAKSEVAIRKALDDLCAENRPSDADALRFADSCARGRLSKFEPCLPDYLSAAYMAEALTDPEGAAEMLKQGRAERS
ncbi:MAG TPA: DEAD/DEAH box helicase [Polyangia bacterium]|nr:DEAD/DEAH box helicase [Polyangia bacterium]